MDDAALVSGLIEHEDWALVALAERYQGPLYGYLFRMTGDSYLAEDLTQETIVRAITGIRRLRQGSSLKAWLYRIASNLAKDHFKRASSVRESPSDQVVAALDGCSGSPGAALAQGQRGTLPEEALEEKMEAARVRAALAALPDRHRDVLLLRYYEEMTIEEIAEITGAPAGTVKSRLHYAIRKLEGMLVEEEVG